MRRAAAAAKGFDTLAFDESPALVERVIHEAVAGTSSFTTSANNATITLTFNANDDGKTVLVKVKQDATGNLTAAFTASGGKTIYWQGGVGPVLTTGANKADLFVFACIGSNIYGKQIPNFLA